MTVSSALIRRSALIALAAASLTLTACAPPVDDASPTSTTSAAPTDAATDGPPADTHSEAPSDPTAAPPTTNPDAGEDVGLACDEAITLQQMYDYNSNISLLGEYTPGGKTLQGKVASFKGLTCQWSNNTSGRTIDLGIAKLDSESLDALANEAVNSSNSVPTYGEEGYFIVESGVGTAQIFTDSYWVVLSSKDFTEPGAVEPLAKAVLGNLP
ncbi:hypothetical protein ACSAGD_08585 [Paramicrobacterium sp. CJ85]|uniref:hypothetical protein n=1 Tax=Paramicrobacterium sp. CJ85 TaxID=3445355 RepID=UPI003F610D01